MSKKIWLKGGEKKAREAVFLVCLVGCREFKRSEGFVFFVLLKKRKSVLFARQFIGGECDLP